MIHSRHERSGGYVHIHHSPDHQLKFCSFDISGGGSLKEWSHSVQYVTSQKRHSDRFDSGDLGENATKYIEKNSLLGAKL